MKTLGGYILMGTAAVACPCHLVVTMPLILAVFGGTAVGAFLTENPGVVFGLFTASFAAALWAGKVLLSRRNAGEDECTTCDSVPQQAPPVAASRRGAQPGDQRVPDLAGMQRR